MSGLESSLAARASAWRDADPDPETRAELTCDGRVLGCIEAGDRLQVKTASERITLLHPPDHDYYKLLRSKLHWGRGSVER